MIIKYLHLLLLLLPLQLLASDCLSPTKGVRVWNLAAQALTNINKSESIIDDIISAVAQDLVGSFTMLSAIAQQAQANESLSYAIETSLEDLEQTFNQTVELTSMVEQNLQTFIAQLEVISADTAGTYTALSALQTTIISQLSELNTDLENISSSLSELIVTTIAHDTTISSQLQGLQTDIDLVISVLDVFDITRLLSSVDTIGSIIGHVGTGVDTLNNIILTDFAGVFTALNQQLLTAQTVESLVADIALINQTDLSGVYTALAQLETTVDDINTLVDVISLINTEILVTSIESHIDQALIDITNAQEALLNLPSLVDHTISLLEPVPQVLIGANSALDTSLTLIDAINSLADIISSKMDVLNDSNNISALEALSVDIQSDIDQINGVVATSTQLQAINSKLDPINETALTIESYVDIISDASSGIQKLNMISKAELLADVSANVVQTRDLVEANMATLVGVINDIDSLCDIILDYSASNLDQVIDISSQIGVINSVIDALPLPAIGSSLSVIAQEDISIESKLNLYTPVVTVLETLSEELVQDMQETWTVLNVIQTSLDSSDSTLTNASALLSGVGFSITGVFTVIDAIIVQEQAVDTKVNTYTSLVAALNANLSIDFSGIFTALNTLNRPQSLAPIQSLLSTISSELVPIQNVFGIPIYGSQLPLTITTPGRYYLAENINYGGASDAIIINTSNVSLDFAGRFLQYTGASGINGIQINNLFSNIKIFGGAMYGFNTYAILAQNDTNVLIYDMVSDAGIAFLGNLTRNVGLSNFTGTGGIATLFIATNCKVNNCTFFNTGCGPGDFANFCLENCLFFNTSVNAISFFGSNGSYGVIAKNIVQKMPNGLIDTTSSVVTSVVAVKDNIFLSATSNAISPRSSSSAWVITNNTIANSNNGINNLSGTPSNFFIGFNTLLQNISANINLQGAHTYLGNFAFNTNAVGNPNNTNYTVSTSNITGKFVTGGQRTGFSGSFPDTWHNINMLP